MAAGSKNGLKAERGKRPIQKVKLFKKCRCPTVVKQENLVGGEGGKVVH